jgi:hypothetical protein
MLFWELKKRGCAEKTVEGYSKTKMLAKHIHLDNPENVEVFIANQAH